MGRVLLIILDSVGIGELPDAGEYGDEGSNTLANTAMAVGGLKMPNLAGMGLGNIHPLEGVPPVTEPRAAYGKMGQLSAGKDTITGHWELAGIVLDRPFPTYPTGFPTEIIEEFTRRIERQILGNKAASGTEIIEELGAEHMRTARPIVYTSADSVFQIAAHEAVIPLAKLYDYCQIARNILVGEHNVARVIARPFVGEIGSFQRTGRRRDFSIAPPAGNLLEKLVAKGREVIALGKVSDIFAGRGISLEEHTIDNASGIEACLRFLAESRGSLIFANLVDYDMIYGHRNNPFGYARALAEFDARVPEIVASLKADDLLIITADHGCDPTTPSTDHSREFVPLLIYGEKVRHGVDLGTRGSFADVAKTVADYLGVPWSGLGVSMWPLLRSAGAPR